MTSSVRDLLAASMEVARPPNAGQSALQKAKSSAAEKEEASLCRLSRANCANLRLREIEKALKRQQVVDEAFGD